MTPPAWIMHDGAQIAEEMLQYRIREQGTGSKGRRVLTAVMVKDSKRYAATGACGFDEGSKVSTLDAKGQQACFTCHVPLKEQGYVLTRYVDR